MALPSPPNPLTAFVKTVFSPDSGVGWPWLNFYDYYHQMTASEGHTWRRFSIRCSEGPTTLRADEAYITFDIVNYTNGLVDDSWTTDDYASAQGQLSLILQAWLPYMDASKQFDQLTAYVMAFNPDYVVGQPGSSPFLPSGPPDYVSQLALVGTGTGAVQASQVAFSVTELVPLRKHWGRFYLPFPDANVLAGDWQATAAVVDAVANAVHGAYGNLASHELFPVIPQTQHAKVKAQALLQITGVQVDSNPDVIRRRRRHTTRYRKTLDVAAATKPA